MVAADILRDVALAHGVSVADLTRPSRRRELAQARWEAAWRLREEPIAGRRERSYPQIGRLLNCDYSTARYSVLAHEARLAMAEGRAPAPPHGSKTWPQWLLAEWGRG